MLTLDRRPHSCHQRMLPRAACWPIKAAEPGDERCGSESCRLVWAVGLLEEANLVIVEVHIERCDRVGQVMRLGGTNDRAVYHGVPQHLSLIHI